MERMKGTQQVVDSIVVIAQILGPGHVREAVELLRRTNGGTFPWPTDRRSRAG